MQHRYSIFLVGLMIHFSPLSAEDFQDEISPSFPTLALTASEEEVSLSSLDREFSLLDKEFEAFKEELEARPLAISDESLPLMSQEEVLPLTIQPLAEAALITQENFSEPLKDAPLEEWEEEVPTIKERAPTNANPIAVDLQQAFIGAPVIYSCLFAMSVCAVCIWLYFILSMRTSARFSGTLLKEMRNKLNSNQFEEALLLCEKQQTLFCKMVSSGILSRRHGLPVMIEAMKAEGKRSTISFWQKLGLLSDIAIIAPMLGLLGTVLGMFYAFYNVNRSIESISVLFDGLGVSVGTTVAGLVVAILALILHSTAKYRLVKALAHIENEAQTIAVLIDDRTSILKG